MYTKTILVIALVLICATANAAPFIWTENFEGPQQNPWEFYFSGNDFAGITDDGTGNNVMRISAVDGTGAYVLMPASTFMGMDSSQNIDVYFDLYLENVNNNLLYTVATNFTNEIQNGNQLSNVGTGLIGSVPVGEWVNFHYQFIPDNGTTNKLWINNDYKGEFTNTRILSPEEDYVAFGIGFDDGGTGAAMWDNFTITGNAQVPEPGSIAVLLAGLGGLIIRKRR